jgi:PAS domain S-box-containing protein
MLTNGRDVAGSLALESPVSSTCSSGSYSNSWKDEGRGFTDHESSVTIRRDLVYYKLAEIASWNPTLQTHGSNNSDLLSIEIIIDHQFRIIRASPEIEKLLGYGINDLIGISVLSLFTATYRKRIESILEIHSGIDFKDNEESLLRRTLMQLGTKDGSSKTLSTCIHTGQNTYSGQLHYSIKLQEIDTIVFSCHIMISDHLEPIIVVDGDQEKMFDRLFGSRELLELIPCLKQAWNICFKISGNNESYLCQNRLDLFLDFIIRKKFFVINPHIKNSDSIPVLLCLPVSKRDVIESTVPLGASSLDIIIPNGISSAFKISSQSGLIGSCNSIFSRYLFGHRASQLMNKASITNLFPAFFDALKKHIASDLNDQRYRANDPNTKMHRRHSSSDSKNMESHMNFNDSPDMQSRKDTIDSWLSLNAQHQNGTLIPCRIKVIPEYNADSDHTSTRSRSLIINVQYILPFGSITKDATAIFRNDVDILSLMEKCSIKPFLSDIYTPDPGNDMKSLIISTDISSPSSPPMHPIKPIPLSISNISQITLSPIPMPLSMLGERCFPDIIDHYRVIKSIGEGACGSVQLVIIRQDPLQKKFIMKKIVKSKVLSEEWIDLPRSSLPSELSSEVSKIPMELHCLDLLRKHPHPYLMDMIFSFEDEQNYYILTQVFGSGLDLFEFIDRSTDYLPCKLVRKIFWQAVKAVQHLHKLKIVHRDIKDENIIIDNNCNIKLIDFGSCAFYGPDKSFSNFCGTMEYVPPEILLRSEYEGPAQDVWALGILLYTLQFKENPFKTRDEILHRILRIPFIPIQGRESVDLIAWMLERDQYKRPTIDQILSHPFFRVS